MTVNDLAAALPLIALTLGVASVLFLELSDRVKDSRVYTGIATVWCLLAWVGSFANWNLRDLAFSDLIYVDPFSFVFSTLILGGTALCLLLHSDRDAEQRLSSGVDINALMLIAAAGGIVMVTSAHLLVFFIGFELLSISVYVLTGSARGERASAEASFKYFILGAFSAALMLYGMALLYQATGSLELNKISKSITTLNDRDPILLIGTALLMFGLVFKIGLAPFHFWKPDVYQGAPVSVTTFMAVVVLAAAVGSLLRIFGMGLNDLALLWTGFLTVVCALTMTVGNLVALRQRSIKRLLAYSSIAHAGYMLLGVLTPVTGGWEAVTFYVFAYGAMTIVSFGVVLVATAGSDVQYDRDSIDSFKGFGWKHPLLGGIFTLAIFSLAGFPPFVGFFGKFYLFKAALQGGFVGLTVLAALNSVVSLYYYLKVLVAMYFAEEKESGVMLSPRRVWGSDASLAIALVLMLLGGIFSNSLLNISRVASASLERYVKNTQVSLYDPSANNKSLDELEIR